VIEVMSKMKHDELKKKLNTEVNHHGKGVFDRLEWSY
jgi:uncharacterized protein (DUF302 family)